MYFTLGFPINLETRFVVKAFEVIAGEH